MKRDSVTPVLFKNDCRYLPKIVGGCDEAGRGPLAGPVVCAAVIMPLNEMLDGIDDSKKVAEKERERLYEEIVKRAVAFKIAVIERDVIDDINILQATKRGMLEAAGGIATRADLMLIDAVKIELDIPVKAIIKGDAISYNIAAASILAKVSRDRIMREYDRLFPGYGFVRHKGYATREHIEALKRLGPCAQHRHSFIGNFWGGQDEEE